MCVEISFKGAFSFKNDKILQVQLSENLFLSRATVFLRLERVGFAVARLDFVDGGQAECDIPVGLTVQDETHGGVPVLPLLDKQYFVLAWSDNYSILQNGNALLELANQRQWAITGSCALHVEVIDV
jgi:hypothetical protein